METVGVVGIGDMGSGLAKNLMAAGFVVRGFDLKADRLAAFAAAGGTPCGSSTEVGQGAEAAFVMVMNGDEAKEVLFGADGTAGLTSTMAAGSVILLSATVHAHEAREIAAMMAGGGIHLIDTPVSGGYPGAQGGTLTMMAAGTDEALSVAHPAMTAVSGTIHRVGTVAGMGQTVKACLQSLIGSIFSATFEASALAAKAGVDADALYKVFSTSSAGSGITNVALDNVINGNFHGTGSHINTMHKDLTISMALAGSLGVPLFTAATAMQLFQAGRTKDPDGDNQVVARISEDIVGARLRRTRAGSEQ